MEPGIVFMSNFIWYDPKKMKEDNVWIWKTVDADWFAKFLIFHGGKHFLNSTCVFYRSTLK